MFFLGDELFFRCCLGFTLFFRIGGSSAGISFGYSFYCFADVGVLGVMEIVWVCRSL